MKRPNGLLGLGAATQETAGVAFFAHIGGFVFGLVMTLVFMVLVPQPPRSRRKRMIHARAGRRGR